MADFGARVVSAFQGLSADSVALPDGRSAVSQLLTAAAEASLYALLRAWVAGSGVTWFGA